MDALRAATERLRELARDADPGPESLARLNALVTRVLSSETSPARLAWLNKSIGEICDGFSRDAGKAAALAARLDAIRRAGGGGGGGTPVASSSPLLASLAGLSVDDLYRALMALKLPAAAPADAHLEAALAAQRLDLRYRLDAFLVAFEVEGPIEFVAALTHAAGYLRRLAILDSFVEKHANLAGAAPPPAN